MSDVEVRVKMTPLQAGKLLMRKYDLEDEVKALKEKIQAAKNCLVCLPIGDPAEIVKNTYEILETKGE